jgi:hypothetical protein
MSKERAFVRYTKAGKIVPGSMILTNGSYPSGPGLWKEITMDLCCENNNNNTMNYKVYTALLSQSGTDDPTAVVLENTLGENLTWTRDNVGFYYVISPGGLFVEDKTFVLVSYNDTSSTGQVIWSRNFLDTSDPTRLYVSILDATFNYQDSFTDISIEIRVYP